MSEHIKNSIKKNKPHFLKYKKYISDNDWTTLKAFEGITSGKGKPKTDVDLRSEEFLVQNELIKAILERLKVFVKKSGGDQHLPIFKTFVKDTLKIISLHTDRADGYISDSNISNIKDVDLRASEIAFHNTLFKAVSSIDDTVSALNIKEDASATTGIEFLNEAKAPLSMHNIISVMYPEIIKELESKGIDFESQPEPKLHIHNENPPKWNTDKHYWEQDKDTLQYYVDEFKKFNNGINIDGYFMSGWMYYHMNAFVTPVPEEVLNKNSGEYESKDIIKSPPLRDNEEYVFTNYNDAKRAQTMLFLAATRRAAKTTLIASHLDWGATIGLKELLCAGGSTKDLNQIAKNFKISITNKNPAFAIYNVSNDWTSKIELGLKNKANKTILLATLNIVNLDSGGDKKSEVLAGYTPDIFVLDEIMKAPFIEQLEALKPALNGANGKKRCTPILSGTGGNYSLSADALSVLNFPEENDILPMNWELLERGVPEEFRSWVEDKVRPFGTFIPGHMSIGKPKYKTTLAKFLERVDSKELDKIEINVTDWEGATKMIDDERDKKIGNKAAYMKEIIYIPKTTSEIFLSGRESPFPTAEAKAHKQYLLQTGIWDRRRDLYRDTQGNIRSEVSTRPLADFPHKGGVFNAPFLIFEDLPTEKPKYGTYTAGFDDYAVDDSDTSSLASFYVMKNKVIGDPFSEKIVASITFKPQRHQEVYEKWLMLMEAYNLEGTCFGENFNYAIKDYLDKKHLADKYLAPSLDFTQTFNIPNNLKRKTGWNPTTSKKTLFNLFVDYCNETFEAEDEDGNTVTLKGVQRIDDIGLLEEIIQWNENLNVDRCTSAMAAYAFVHYLNSSQRWKVKNKEQLNNKVENRPTATREKSFFSTSNRNRSFYRVR